MCIFFLNSGFFIFCQSTQCLRANLCIPWQILTDQSYRLPAEVSFKVRANSSNLEECLGSFKACWHYKKLWSQRFYYCCATFHRVHRVGHVYPQRRGRPTSNLHILQRRPFFSKGRRRGKRKNFSGPLSQGYHPRVHAYVKKQAHIFFLIVNSSDQGHLLVSKNDITTTPFLTHNSVFHKKKCSVYSISVMSL